MEHHVVKLIQYRALGGYTNSVEREITNFRRQIQDISVILEESV